ncbi:DNA-binding response regulator [Gammaproteobacteria bacterium]
MNLNLRILLADDHKLFREALRSLLTQEKDIEVVAETGNGLEIVELAKRFSPNIVCMDIGMPGMNGIEATRQLLVACPSVKVIALSAYADEKYVVDMIDAGATAYITKAEAAEELLRALDAVRHNRRYLCPSVVDIVTMSLFNKDKSGNSPSPLGNRERQVLQLVAEGKSSVQIAELLHIAQSTVDVHRRNIMRKLNLHSIAELTRYVINNGYFPSPPPPNLNNVDIINQC